MDRPVSRSGRIDPKVIDPATDLPKKATEDVNAELRALFNRLSVFSDDDLVLEAMAYVETYTADAAVHEITEATAAFLAESMATRGTMVGMQRAGLSALANIATAGDRLQDVVVRKQAVGLALAAMDTYPNDVDLVYKAFDVLATLVANNAQAREEVSNPICLRTIFATSQRHRGNVDIQFGAACTLAGAVMNAPATVKTVLVLDGLKQLIDGFRNAARAMKATGATPAVIEDWQRVMEWTQLALRNIVRSALVTPELLDQTDFGKFGECVPVDELKMQLKFDVKRIAAKCPRACIRPRVPDDAREVHEFRRRRERLLALHHQQRGHLPSRARAIPRCRQVREPKQSRADRVCEQLPGVVAGKRGGGGAVEGQGGAGCGRARHAGPPEQEPHHGVQVQLRADRADARPRADGPVCEGQGAEHEAPPSRGEREVGGQRSAGRAAQRAAHEPHLEHHRRQQEVLRVPDAVLAAAGAAAGGLPAEPYGPRAARGEQWAVGRLDGQGVPASGGGVAAPGEENVSEDQPASRAEDADPAGRERPVGRVDAPPPAGEGHVGVGAQPYCFEGDGAERHRPRAHDERRRGVAVDVPAPVHQQGLPAVGARAAVQDRVQHDEGAPFQGVHSWRVRQAEAPAGLPAAGHCGAVGRAVLNPFFTSL